MSKILLQFTLFLLIAAVMVTLVTVSGCTDPIATSALQIDAVHETFPSATDISQMSISRDVQTSRRPGNHIINEIRDSTGLLGYCVESKLISRSGPFKIRTFIDNEFVVKRVIVTSYPWERGREVCKRAFTSQFEGKGPEDAIEIGKDIDAISGATISCRTMSDGIREAIEILKDIRESQVTKPI